MVSMIISLFSRLKKMERYFYIYIYVSIYILNNFLNASEDCSTASKIGHSEE